MKKRFLSLTLAFAMVLSLLVIPAQAKVPQYTDIDGHWASSAILRWSDYGIVRGNNGEFRPDSGLTRGELATVLANLLHLTEKSKNIYGDLKGDEWYSDAILMCTAAGIMSGDGVNCNAQAPITRQEAMVMIAKALGIAPDAHPDLSKFDDADNVANWAAGYVSAMTHRGIVNGLTEDTAAPEDGINRASTMVVLDRAIAVYADESGATVDAAPDGIVLVAAPGVTLTGKAEDILVAAGAQDGITTLKDVTITGTATVTAPSAEVLLTSESTAENVMLTEAAVESKVVIAKGATVDTITAAAPKSEVSVAGAVETVTTTASEAKVDVAKGATVGDITAEGEDTAISVSGKVDHVTVSETAANTEVKANSGSTIKNVDNAAEGTTVSGSGKVENVTTSGDNTSVTTSGTKVEAAEGTTGTTAGSKPVAGGSTATTGGAVSSSGSSSSDEDVTPPSYTYAIVTKAGENGTITLNAASQFNTWPTGDGLVATFTPASGYSIKSVTLQRPGQEAADITSDVLRESDTKVSGTFRIGAGDNLTAGTYTFTAEFAPSVTLTFVKTDGTEISTATVASGSKVAAPEVTLEEGQQVKWHDGTDYVEDLATLTVSSDMTLTAVVGSNKFADGNGSEDYPYLIADAEQFANISAAPSNTYFKLTEDITVTEVQDYSDPWGDPEAASLTKLYRQALDGDGHTITAPKNGYLFGAVWYSTIQNVTVELNGETMAYFATESTFDGITTTGYATLGNNSGAFLTYPYQNFTMMNCINEAKLTAAGAWNNYNAVFVGYGALTYAETNTFTFENCVNKGSLVCGTASMFIGNISYGKPHVVINNCRNEGLIQATYSGSNYIFNTVSSVNNDGQDSLATYTLDGQTLTYQEVRALPFDTFGGSWIHGPADPDLALKLNADGTTFTITPSQNAAITTYKISVGIYGRIVNSGSKLQMIVVEVPDVNNVPLQKLEFVDDTWVTNNPAAVKSEYEGYTTYTLDGTTYYLYDCENGQYTLDGNPKMATEFAVSAYDANGKLVASAGLSK